MILQAYGTIPSRNEGDAVESIWRSCWRVIIQHIGNHYILPGGPIDLHYVETLAEEINHLAVGNFSSDGVLVFSSMILQRDRMVCKGVDIRRLLGWRLQLWQQGEFDLLLQEACHCDQTLRRCLHIVSDDNSIVRIFTKLMLQGKVKAAIRWAIERSGELSFLS